MGTLNGQQMAESPWPHLPLQLRPLADFLDKDGRPSAVLELHDLGETSQSNLEVVYENKSFAGLGCNVECVEQLVKDLQWCGEDAGKHGDDVFDLQSWRLTTVGEQWHTLVYDHVKSSFAHQCRVKKQLSVVVDGLHNGSNGHGNGSQSPQHNPKDWTRFPLSGLSAWTEHVRNFDWASTALGPMARWSELLRSCVLHVMSHPDARLILWGDDRNVIYNEACIQLFGEKHPGCLGRPVHEPWRDMWNDIRPIIEDTFEGKTVKLDRLPLTSLRHGFLEETYWDFVALPVIGSGGHVFGQFIELQEVTRPVIGERRRNAVYSVKSSIDGVNSLPELWTSYLHALNTAVEDVSFAFVYAASELALGSEKALSADYQIPTAKLIGSVGIARDDVNVRQSFTVSDNAQDDGNITQRLIQAWQSKKMVVLRQDDGSLPEYLTHAISGRAFNDTISTAVIAPITSMGGNEVLALVVLGLNPRRPFDEDYKVFSHFLSDFLTRAASLIQLPLEQRRARQIADDMNNELAQQLQLITARAERTEATFTRMASEAPTGVFVFDTDGHALYVNEAYLRMLGLTMDRHLARSADTVTWQEHIHPDDLARFCKAWTRVVEEKAPFTIEHRLKKPWTSVDKASGQEISGETWLLANAFPEVGSDGKITSIQGWLTDISHRKFTDSLVSRKLEEALENKRQTENFIDMTSHEMRNPLSAILQSADNISSTLDAAENTDAKSICLPADVVHELHDAAQTIILCAQHQKRIVDDILTLSKLDASLLVISPDKVQAPTLLDKALRMFEAEISRANITVKMDVEDTYEKLIGNDWVVIDPSRLLQVVINLVTNAIKFTQDAEKREITICLGASYDKPSGKHHGVNFIPTKHMRKAESPLDDWGNGEILYLQIAVADTGRGLSEDDMEKLFQRFSQASPKTYRQYGGSGLGLFISRELCELQGGQIGVSSGNGKTTFTFFVRAKRWVADAPAEKSHRPGLPRFTSQAASPMTYSRRGSVVPRTPSMSELKRVPSIQEDGSGQSVPPKPLSRSSTRQQAISEDDVTLHVLVVEDNLINQKIMSQQLRRAGCIVHVANHGLECLKFIEQSVFCDCPTNLSVILLDLEMPTMDGLTCIREIRERQASGEIKRHVPVIAVTANARSEQISIAIDAGMDQVVTKPFRIPELLPQMHHLVEEVVRRVDGHG